MVQLELGLLFGDLAREVRNFLDDYTGSRSLSARDS